MNEWGGQRVGAGRKKKRPFGTIEGGKEPMDESFKLPPEDLPADQRDFWHRYAPMAVEKRTLTRHTLPAFRMLCQRESEWRDIGKTIEKDGRTYQKAWIDSAGQEHYELKAHPLTSAHGTAFKDVMAGLARFGLAPFGKAEPPQPKPQAKNPFASIGMKQ